MLCAHCATPIPDDSRFCLNCGSLVSDADGQKRASATMDASSTARMERILREDTKGEFEIDRQLGKGGMAAVYLATETRLGRKVAIKVLPPELTFGHGIERFVREAKTAAALDHPNIIPIYRITSGDTIFWYAMKYIEGRTLDELVKEHKLFTIEETVDILGQVADALEYAHRKMVIHRDVKPANMMLDDQGRVIVTDFGIAKALTEGTLTASGAAIGTPYYMSPEQAVGGTVSGAADQYSLGIVAYQMLSGQLPFTGESAVEILHKHTAESPPPLEVLRPGLPPHVYASVERALTKEPAERFPSIRAFVDGLRGIESTERASGTLVVTPAASPKRLSKTGDVAPSRPGVPRVVIAGAVAVVLAAAAAGAYLLTRGRVAPAAPARSQLAPTPRAGSQAPTSARAESSASTTAAPPAERPAAAQPKGPAPTSTTGRVVVSGLPRGARVFADGQRRSGSGFELREGTHIVRMEADGLATVVDTVRVRAGQTSRIAFVARPIPPPVAAAPTRDTAPPPNPLGDRGVLQLSVDPWASIAVDGVARGQSRTLVDTLRAGPHLITLTREGYARIDTTVSIRAGGQHRVAVRMRTP